jgi:ferredoxin
VYGGRTRASMAFIDRLAPYGSRVSLRPQDETGLLDLNAILATPTAGTSVYCCGPEPLLAAVERASAHWPAGSLHVERFSPKPQGDPVLNRSFDIVLRRSQRTLTVPPERSVLSVVEEAGVSVLSSCGEGTCGTCEVQLVSGEPDHRDSVLSAEEQQANTCLMICVSRARSDRLVLDL